MRPRIIKGALPATKDEREQARRQGRSTVVIADSGADAEVVVFPADEMVATGAEFHYRGTVWVITGARRDSGILVAEPLPH